MLIVSWWTFPHICSWFNMKGYRRQKIDSESIIKSLALSDNRFWFWNRFLTLIFLCICYRSVWEALPCHHDSIEVTSVGRSWTRLDVSYQHITTNRGRVRSSLWSYILEKVCYFIKGYFYPVAFTLYYTWWVICKPGGPSTQLAMLYRTWLSRFTTPYPLDLIYGPFFTLEKRQVLFSFYIYYKINTTS